MSPSRSKSKKASKDTQKASSKTSGITNVVNEHANGYSPLLGRFDSLDKPLPSPPNSNGRFHDLEETDDQTMNALITNQEYDTVSNNDSWSGESEDTNKDKTTHQATHQDLIPGADNNNKREKIRQKNEKKHQRQKEKRAQELHERCCGFLMSRKLEALSQQLVSMGFSSEKATMSLILNEGKIEESVAWLLEAAEESESDNKNPNPDRTNLKIDISEELARITTMATNFNCSKQEVERAVVACEGDLDKASETLKTQKQASTTASPQPKQPSLSNQTQPRIEEKDFNYTKSTSIQPKSETKTSPNPTVLKSESTTIKEPVMVMQRPPPQVLKSTWHQNDLTSMKFNVHARSFSPGEHGGYNHNHNHHVQYHHQPLWNRVNTSPLLTPASSLGLFTKSNSSSPSSSSSPPIDWNTSGSMFNLDYNNIDWSLDHNMARSKFSSGGGVWHNRNGSSSSSSSSSGFDLGSRFVIRPGLARDSEMGMGSTTPVGGSREWSSPFEEMDLFSLPRQFVSSLRFC